MFWDGERWLPDDGRPHAQPQPRARRRTRDWLSTAVMILALAALIVPFTGAAAARPSARAQIADWSETSEVAVYQEGNRAITYRGGWVTAYYPDYLGGKARAADAAGAKASLKFRGVAVSWVGPIGPTRGKARVYIDGEQVATVNTWNSSFRPTRVLFQRSWDTVGTHRIAIVTVGTEGHPTVALDAFVVRLDGAGQNAPVDDAGAPIGTTPPEESTPPAESPSRTPDSTAGPTDAPSDAPVPASPEPTVAPTPAPTTAPTPAAPAPTATPAPTPAPTATPAPAPTATTSVRVTSIPALLTALNDNSVTDIVVANGTYRVSPAAAKASNSLWIGSRFADRTRAVTVRAETTGGVVFDGGGGQLGGITFVEGAHDQVWQGFRFTNGMPQESGVIVFGGYANLAPPHHITLRNITVDGLIAGSTPPDGYPIYFSMAAYPGPHDLLIENFTAVDKGVSGALLHFYHDTAGGDPAGNYNARNVVIRNAHLSGSPQPIVIWARSVTNLLIEDTTITGAGEYAVRYEFGSGVTLRRVTSTGSGIKGFYSSQGSAPAGVTFDNVSLN